MADLFQRDKSVISKHIKNVFDEGELQPGPTVAKLATVQKEGERDVAREIEFYNLDVIISVGYRVKSLAGTQFRIWATQRLREYIVKGFTLDDERLKQGGGAYFDELLARIRDIRASEKNFYQKIRDIYATAADYDARAEITQDFFAMAQNKLHWAISKVLRCYQRDIARFVHAQMQEHYWEKAAGYEVKISKGYSELKASAYTASAAEPVLDYRQPPADKSNMAKYLFGGFTRCLYPVQKFQSDSERKLSVILEREAAKWFKPARGQFQIFYKLGADHLEYQPDFVAETDGVIYMLEPKAKNEMSDAEVVAKKDAAVKWCKHASDHAATHTGKKWKYLLIPHDAIAENMTLDGLAKQFAQA